ncbi:hypothetical protein CC86DRAFT_447920 [Ophiobolus disseminans]|uniref:Uncharacterized protein n=1 Tax=Ophiobolus disseminans TaxID=1469910 RepID=A0A6A6ZTE7_9PLEO|nr:hypothetical protein CC86DRAFT_447920 [Ophiobolus disseminans]
MSKRQRPPKQPFEQGVNPPGAARPFKKPRALPKDCSPTRFTPNIGRRTARLTSRGGLASPPATDPRRRSPLFEPEFSYTQSALLEQADDLIDGEDDDTEEEKADPLPEGEGDADDEVEGALEAEDGEPPYRVQAATPFIPRTSSLPEEPDPIVSIRWRACFGDMEKNPVPAAFNSKQDQHFLELTAERLWEWAKRDRAVKTLRRGRDGDWPGVIQLCVAIDRDSSDRVRVDFDLMLVEELNEAPRAAVQVVGSRARLVTATMIQEGGIASVLAAENAGSGMAIGIRDRWCCVDTHCKNYPYVCWLRPGQQARFENHCPVNGNIIAMWARDISKQLATYDEPSDDVRLAILRARDRAEHEKAHRQRSPNSGDNDIRSLTKLLVVGQLNQLNRQPLGELKPRSERLNRLETPSPKPREWVPIKYNHREEMNQHTTNFFNSFKLKHPLDSDAVTNMFNIVCVDGAMDLNMIIGGSGDVLKLWVNHFNLPPGWLFTLQHHALEWQKSYNGLSEKSWRRVERCRKREEKARQKLAADEASSVVSSSDGRC